MEARTRGFQPRRGQVVGQRRRLLRTPLVGGTEASPCIPVGVSLDFDDWASVGVDRDLQGLIPLAGGGAAVPGATAAVPGAVGVVPGSVGAVGETDVVVGWDSTSAAVAETGSHAHSAPGRPVGASRGSHEAGGREQDDGSGHEGPVVSTLSWVRVWEEISGSRSAAAM